MPITATTTTINKRDLTDKTRVVYGTFTFDNSYPATAGGEPIDLGLDTIYLAFFEPTSGYIFEYDSVNKKVLAKYANYPAGASGPFVTVPNLSAILEGIVAPFIAIGE